MIAVLLRKNLSKKKKTKKKLLARWSASPGCCNAHGPWPPLTYSVLMPDTSSLVQQSDSCNTHPSLSSASPWPLRKRIPQRGLERDFLYRHKQNPRVDGVMFWYEGRGRGFDMTLQIVLSSAARPGPMSSFNGFHPARQSHKENA